MKLKINKTFYIVIMIICCFFFQTSAYSLLNSSLTITGNAIARIRNNVRINDFKIHEVSDGVISSYEEFSKTNTNSNVTLPNSDSYIIYKLDIGNYETVEMQLSNITGLSSNLTYELIDYSLHDMICDVTNKCTSGAEKTIYLKIKYASYDSANTNYNVNLNYEFNEFSNVVMVGSNFKNTIPSTATHLVFTDEKPAQGIALTDVSLNKDMGVVGYLDGTTYKVSTRRTGVKAEANADSSYMFSGTALTNVDLNMLDTKSVTNMGYMFYQCYGLISVNFGEYFNTEKVISMTGMFYDCSSIVSLDFSKFNTKSVTSFNYFLRNCASLEIADVSNFDTSNVVNFYSMFRDCKKLSVIDVSNFNTSKATDVGGMFFGCSSVLVLDVSKFDTANVKKISYMFANCEKVEKLVVSNWNTSKVNDIAGLFYMCKSLTSIDLSKWEIKNITSLYGVFHGCILLKELDLSSWDVSDVTSSFWVFTNCESLTELNLSNWKFDGTVDFTGMFFGISSIEYINLTGWSVNDVTSLKSMFSNCRKLKFVDLSFLNTKNVTDTERMFEVNHSLEKIYVGENWDLSNVISSDSMFLGCYNLLNFDSNYIDKTKAYVGEGGYLTSKYKTVMIDGVQYTYEEGMTWGEWVGSKYNTAGFVSNGEYIIFPNEKCMIVAYDPSNYFSFVTDEINSSKEYNKILNGCISGCSGGCN